MTWFKVDDSFHSHPKVLATEPAALGLWVVAGSWCGDNLSNGFVPLHVLPRLLPDAATLAETLVAAGLWKRARGGYQFHQWLEWQPSREKVEAERKANAERQARWRENQKNGKPGKDPSRRYSRVSDTVTNAAPTRPPLKGEGEERAPATQGAAHAPPEDPRVVAEAEEELRLKTEAAVAAIAEHQQRTARGAAAARAAIPKRSRSDQARNGLAALTAAVADMPPLAEPAGEPAEQPLAQVIPISLALDR